ncbi:DEAD/DEAH box helicase [Desulfatiferula olefinivorans]
MVGLKDLLSHLNYTKAVKYLGPSGKEYLTQGGKYTINPDDQVRLTDSLFMLTFDDGVVTLSLDEAKEGRLRMTCSRCDTCCEHMGAALSLILEEKTALGLAEAPPEPVPVESLSEEDLVKRAIDERTERAKKEKMTLTALTPGVLWSDYIVASKESGKSYRISLRGWSRGQSYCSCPDYRKNTLGTCKHLIYALDRVRTRFKKADRDTPYTPKDVAVFLSYGADLELRILVPPDTRDDARVLLDPFTDIAVRDVAGLIGAMGRVQALGESVLIYPDAEEYIREELFKARMAERIAEIRNDPAGHPLRKTLLKTDLLPYQLDGIAFAAGCGRAVLADDMGLGKTIQGIGTAELLARFAGIERVLVICPASLKSQWRIEVGRFSDRSVSLVLGPAAERAAYYDDGAFFTVCNYEQVLRDILAIEKVNWDLIILDEGQRIKNWEAKTSRIIKSLTSRFALVLSGTPLENNLDELYSVVEFIDDRRLGAAFRFFNRHKVVDQRGKLLGYANLDELREKLKPILLRRTRSQVMKELPPRTTDVLRIPPTDEQLELSRTHRLIIQSIINKKYISEMDLLRLQKALLMCRMAADSTFLVDKQMPAYSSKLDELAQLLDKLSREEDRKIIIFTEWTTMIDLIQPILTEQGLDYVRLDGSVPQKKRQELVYRFQNDPACRVFITTNAGSTGLNLQAANTIINVDLPWNPAILEQRIARAHRMGQTRPVHVFLLVTENTLEENLLSTLSAKNELSLAVLDPDSEKTAVDLQSGMEELKKRLEVLLGRKPDAAEDVSARTKAEEEAERIRRKQISKTGGVLLGAAFDLIGEMFASKAPGDQDARMAELMKEKLKSCMETDEDGNLKLTLTLPDESFLDKMAASLARLSSL